MNLEQIPTRTLARWGLCALAAVVAWVLLGFNDLAGLIPVTLVLLFLIVFRPPKTQITDADLDALLGRA
jgi:hypothetical protein